MIKPKERDTEPDDTERRLPVGWEVEDYRTLTLEQREGLWDLEQTRVFLDHRENETAKTR